MRVSAALKATFLMSGALLYLQGQDTPPVDPQTEVRGLPARVAPSEYQAQARAKTLTIAAEFRGRSVPTMDGRLTTNEYVVVEAGLYGDPGAKLRISAEDFSLRINGRKPALRAQRYGLVLASLKDPEWEPPEKAASKSKTRVGGGGDQQDPGAPPPEVRIPVPVQRAMAQRVQQAALPEGDRALPQGGLLFFQYRGRVQGIRTVELIYKGPGGEVTLKLQPN